MGVELWRTLTRFSFEDERLEATEGLYLMQ